MANTSFLNLEWNNYLQEIGNFLKETSNNETYSDITLVAEDGPTIRSCRLILSACSEFFKKTLEGYKGLNTIFYMKGISHTVLKHIVRFISMGEVKIEENYLNEFLVVCEDLKIKGMTHNNQLFNTVTFPKTEKVPHNEEEFQDFDYKLPKPNLQELDTKLYGPTIPNSTDNEAQRGDNSMLMAAEEYNGEFNILHSSPSISEVQTLECDQCEKTFKNIRNLRNHKEIHMTDVQYQCNDCSKVFQKQDTLRIHRMRNHKK